MFSIHLEASRGETHTYKSTRPIYDNMQTPWRHHYVSGDELWRAWKEITRLLARSAPELLKRKIHKRKS